MLRDEPISQRVFNGWDLRVARGPKVSIEAAVAALHSPSTQLLKYLVDKPTSLLSKSWEDIFATVVIPRLLEVHPVDLNSTVRRGSTRNIWHARADSGAELAGALLAPRSDSTARYIDSLIEQGAGFTALYHEVLEPAQLHLGRLWDAERCDDFHLSIGLSRLHLEVRRLNAAVPGDHACRPGQSVLLCLQPEEPHGVGLAMSSEVFERSGWDVSCEFPADNRALCDSVRGHWFDVLKLSQSGSLRRDSRLTAMRATIDAARRASCNPALIVMVDGRTFAERPQVYRAVHADAVALSAHQGVPMADRILAANRNLLKNIQVGNS